MTVADQENLMKQKQNEVKIFNNEVFGNVRATVIDDKVWFVGKDVAEALGYTNPQKAVRDHCKNDGVTIRSLIDSMGRQQQAKYINQRNVIRLIMRSDLPQAEVFQDWVEDEIIPSVLQTGSYNAPQLTVEQKMVLDIVFPQDDVQQALAVQVYGNYKYNSGHEVGFEEGHEQGYEQGYDEGYDECASYSMSTTVMVKKLNEKRGGSFNGKRLTTTVFFDYLGYLGYGQRKMVKGSRQFFATDEFIEIMKEDRLGRVDVIGQGKYKRHVFKWSEEWIKVLNLDKLEAYMTLTDKDTKGY